VPNKTPLTVNNNQIRSKLGLAMKNLGYLATRVFNTPLLMSPSKMDVIINVLAPRMGLDVKPSVAADMSVPKPYRLNAENDGIGIIPIYGSLVHRALGMDAMSGIISYDDIRSQFKEAVNDSSIKSILLDAASFGGEVSGCFCLADDIYQARGIKPIYALVNEDAYSGAYALISAADTIFVPPTGGVGSIGVIMVHLDQSKFDEKIGAKYSIIYSGDRKKDFNFHEPLPDNVRDDAQKMIDDVREIFVRTVARNRQISEQAVRDTEAAIYQGQAAVDIGLADAVMSFSQVIEAITESNPKGANMPWFGKKAEKTQSQNTNAQESDLTPEEVYAQGYEEGMKAGNTAGMQAASQTGVQEGIKQGIEQERKRCLAVQEQVAAIGHLIDPKASVTLLNGLTSSGATIEMAGQQIIGLLSASQQQAEITSTVSPLSTGEINPVLAEAKRRAQAAQKGA